MRGGTIQAAQQQDGRTSQKDIKDRARKEKIFGGKMLAKPDPKSNVSFPEGNEAEYWEKLAADLARKIGKKKKELQILKDGKEEKEVFQVKLLADLKENTTSLERLGVSEIKARAELDSLQEEEDIAMNNDSKIKTEALAADILDDLILTIFARREEVEKDQTKKMVVEEVFSCRDVRFKNISPTEVEIPTTSNGDTKAPGPEVLGEEKFLTGRVRKKKLAKIQL